MKYEYGVEYKHDGVKPDISDLPDDVEIKIKVTNYDDSGHIWQRYCSPKKLVGRMVSAFIVTDERYKPKADDSSWNERGELPPVGTECEIKNKHATPEWAQPDFHYAKIKAYGDELVIIETGSACNGKKESVGSIDEYEFRPIPTERKRLIDKAYKLLESRGWPCSTIALGDLYDANWRPVKQQTEEEFVKQTHDYLPDAMARTAYRAGCRFIEQGE